ncbi:MAG: hypothetical protein ACRDHP_14765 [Ktedonobacterales bacterium]
MEKRFVAFFGTIAKHVLHGLRQALRAVALTFVIVALLAGAATEVIASFLTHSFPTGPTHLAAAAIAIAFGYAAAITVAIEEILRAIIKAVELIVEEAEKVEKKAVEEIEVLSHKAEEEAVRFGRSAVTDAGAFGRNAAHDAGSLGHLVTGAVSGAAGAVGGAVGDVEHGVTSHLPGHHNSIPAPVTSGSATTLPADANQR